MRLSDGRNRSPEWLWIATAWFAFALFDATKTVGVMRAEGMHHNWPVLFVLEMLSWLPWATATAVIFWLGQRPPLAWRPNAAWLLHTAACISTGLVSSAWTALLVIDFRPFGAPQPPGFLQHWLTNFYDGLPTTIVFYALILMVRGALDSRERLAAQKMEVAQLNEQLANAHLNALRHQIEPHFLFNALNAVAGLVREGRAEAAADMIASLSDFLRRTLDASARQEVQLGDEAEFVQRYLAIQQARFAERLRFDIEIPDELRSASVPNLILQPLVENAVKHGIAKRKDGGTVRVAASASGNMLMLSVSNDGPVLSAQWDCGERGIGVSNVRSRLRGLYGARSTFDIRNRLAGGVQVSIAIPLCSTPFAGEAAL
jgi:signal transduction histidine kinase